MAVVRALSARTEVEQQTQELQKVESELDTFIQVMALKRAAFFFFGMAIKVIVWSHEEYQWMIFHEIGWGDDTTHKFDGYVMI